MEEKDLEIKEENLQNETELNQEIQDSELDMADTQSPNNEIEAQLTEQKDKFLRLFAEFDNYKKRMAKDKLEYMTMAGKDVILDMISVSDDFQRAIHSFESTEDLSAIKEGVGLIYDKLNKAIERKGVTKVLAKGLPFDVEKHEAITEVPVTDESQKGTVIDEIESGYIMNEKVIRFAKVVVGK